MQHEPCVVGDANLLKFLDGIGGVDVGQGCIVAARGGAVGCDGDGGGVGNQQANERDGLHLKRCRDFTNPWKQAS